MPTALLRISITFNIRNMPKMFELFFLFFRYHTFAFFFLSLDTAPRFIYLFFVLTATRFIFVYLSLSCHPFHVVFPLFMSSNLPFHLTFPQPSMAPAAFLYRLPPSMPSKLLIHVIVVPLHVACPHSPFHVAQTPLPCRLSPFPCRLSSRLSMSPKLPFHVIQPPLTCRLPPPFSFPCRLPRFNVARPPLP